MISVKEALRILRRKSSRAIHPMLYPRGLLRDGMCSVRRSFEALFVLVICAGLVYMVLKRLSIFFF